MGGCIKKNLWFLSVHRGFAEFFRGRRSRPRKIEEKIEANPEVHTKNHGFFFWGGLKTRTIWEVFQSATEVFLSVRGLRRFILCGTPKKKRPGSRKTSHIVWVLLPQPSFPSARPITKPSQKNKTQNLSSGALTIFFWGSR
jgi:hypothetical protein